MLTREIGKKSVNEAYETVTSIIRETEAAINVAKTKFN